MAKATIKGTCYFKATLSNGYSVAPKFFFWPKSDGHYEDTMDTILCEVEKTCGYIYMIKPLAYYKDGVKRIPFKIGYTRHADVQDRLKQLQIGSFIPLHLYKVSGKLLDVRNHERTVHSYILEHFPNAKGNENAGSEWFWLSRKQLKKVEKLLSDITDCWSTGL